MNNIYIWFNAIVWSHSYSLSILYKGKIFAIELERLNRLKAYPSTEFWKLLPSLQREMFNDIDNKTKNKNKIIAFKNYIDDTINGLLKKYKFDFNNIEKIYTINFPFNISVRWYEYKVEWYKKNYHHLFHASSAYYPSSFNNAAILCMDHDGYDEELGGINPMHSIWFAEKQKINFLYSDNFSPKRTQAWIWAVYENHSKICQMWEGTFMGLSWYWKNKLDHITIFDYSSGGPLISKNFLEKNSYKWLEDFRLDIINWFRKAYKLDTKKQNKNIIKSIYPDIADKVQKEIEEAILFLANKAYKLTKSKNICIAWWVWLNILANNRILKETPFENIFVQPACHDWGLSLWAVYYLYHKILWQKERVRLVCPWLWIIYSWKEIINNLKKYENKLIYQKLWNNKYKKVASLLKNNKIIWWFQWWSEFWPRALWFRSILASPIDNKMKNKVNDIKERERYRPLAPIMMENYFKEYLDTKYPSPYMTLVANVFKNKLKKIPSVVHIDKTARYQTVNKNQNLEIYKLLKEFYNQTKIPILINTSFNQRDEPIVETPDDAIKMFLSTNLDYLVIWDYLVTKRNIYKEYKFSYKKSKKNYDNKLNQSINNNFRWETLLKLIWIKKFGLNYNYNIWDKWIKIFYLNKLEFIIEVKKKWKKYYKEINNIGLDKIQLSWIKDLKILKIVEFYLIKNNKIIYNLIKWI